MELTANRSMKGPIALLVLGGIFAWLLYAVGGFRNHASPLEISEGHSGSAMRQLLFGTVGMIGLLYLFSSGRLGTAIGSRVSLVVLASTLLISTSWSEQTLVTLKRSLIFVLGAFPLLACVHGSRNPVRLMQNVLVGFATFAALSSLLLFLVFPSSHTLHPARGGLAGLSNHPNTLGPFPALGLLLSFGMRPASSLVRVSQAIMLGALIMTQSMTSLAMLLTGVIVHGFLTAKPRRRGQCQIGTLVFVIIITLVGVATVADALLGSVGRDRSLSGRDVLWSEVWEEAQDKIAVGHGYGGFWYEGRGRDLVVTWNPRQSHNAYLDLLVDLGLLGVILTLLLFHGQIWLAWRRLRDTQARSIAGNLVAVCVAVLVVYGYGQSFFFKLDSFPFFCVMWCSLILTNSDQNRIENDVQLPPLTTKGVRV